MTFLLTCISTSSVADNCVRVSLKTTGATENHSSGAERADLLCPLAILLELWVYYFSSARLL